MTMRILVEVDPSRALDLMSHAEHAIEAASIIRWMEGPLRAWYENEVVQRYAHEGDYRSGHWEPLTEATQRIRKSEGYPPNEINIRTEELFNFSLSSSIETEGDSVSFVTPELDLLQGELMDKYMHAQYGGPNTAFSFADTPPRPVVAFDENTDTQTILVLLATHVAMEVGGSGSVISMGGAA